MTFPSYMALVLFGLFGSVVLHEAGHLLAGMLVGNELLFVYVWPVVWARRGGRSSFAFDASHRNPMGMAGTFPKGDAPGLRRRQAVVIGAGPLASLLVALGAGVLALAFEGWAAAALFSLAGVSAIFFVLNLLPLSLGGFLSDGARLLDLARRTPQMEVMLTHVRLAGLTNAGVRARDWPEDFIRLLLEHSTGPLGTVAHYQAYTWHADRGEAEQAEVHRAVAAEGVAHLAPLLRRGMQLDMAIAAALDGRLEEARQLRAAAGRATALVDPHVWPLVDAAIALTEGRTDDAEAALRQAHGLLGAAMMPATVPMAEELMGRMRSRLEAG